MFKLNFKQDNGHSSKFDRSQYKCEVVQYNQMKFKRKETLKLVRKTLRDSFTRKHDVLLILVVSNDGYYFLLVFLLRFISPK